MAKGKAIHWRLRDSVSVPSCGKLDKGAHQEVSSIGSIIISLKGQEAQESVFLPIFVRRTLFIERKGVGDMRVRLYSF